MVYDTPFLLLLPARPRDTPHCAASVAPCEGAVVACTDGSGHMDQDPVPLLAEGFHDHQPGIASHSLRSTSCSGQAAGSREPGRRSSLRGSFHRQGISRPACAQPTAYGAMRMYDAADLRERLIQFQMGLVYPTTDCSSPSTTLPSRSSTTISSGVSSIVRNAAGLDDQKTLLPGRCRRRCPTYT